MGSKQKGNSVVRG